MNNFKVNGKNYTAIPFTFNTICDLEDMGITLQQMKDKAMSTLRAYFALCLDGDKELAGKELQEHIVSGGDMESIAVAMNIEIENSDFFQALNKKAKAENASAQSKTATKK